MRAAMLAAALMLAACEEQDDFVPQEGQWEVVESQTDNVSCADFIDIEFGPGVTLDINDDIPIAPDEEQLQIELRLDSRFLLRCDPSYPSDFNCRLEAPSDGVPYRNDTMIRDLLDGIVFFDSAGSAVVSLTVALDCVGEQCPPGSGTDFAPRPELPCVYRQTLAIEYVGE